MMRIFLYLSLLVFFTSADCPSSVDGNGGPSASEEIPTIAEEGLKVGAEQTAKWKGKLAQKRIGLLVNQSSLVGQRHLLDTMLSLSFDVQKIFSPEHGFRGTADAGEKVSDGKDPKSGLPVISLYGNSRKPTPEMLAGLDVLVFDIQDVGARFYTYISSMHYAMEACAEQGIEFLVLDRPNPNGHYVDGPLLHPDFKSFVGMHEVPVVHGMTVGEYAQMINGEGWLSGGLACKLEVISCTGYDHQTRYNLPVKPSPNLPNESSILLYPSLCFFEGTIASIGRGTSTPFQVIGHPDFKGGDYQFTPVSTPGATHPKLENKLCKGYNLSEIEPTVLHGQAKLDLSRLIEFQNQLGDNFFLENGFFDKLAGSSHLREQILSGLSEDEIRWSWQAGLKDFKEKRRKYLLYSDFE